jgi:hypothetical protein
MIEQTDRPYPADFVVSSRPTIINNNSGWSDISGNNRHATLFNSPTFVFDKFSSLSFDGVNDYVDTGYDLS